ncbi:23167_t:CDS:1, partial [Racocetra persica]
ALAIASFLSSFQLLAVAAHSNLLIQSIGSSVPSPLNGLILIRDFSAPPLPIALVNQVIA